MKTILLLVSLLLVALPANLAKTRQQYLDASVSAAAAESFYENLSSVNETGNDNTMIAYKAASIILKAKFSKGLGAKKKLFTQGAKLLDAVVVRDADNYEVRLLRLSIQENAPKITGYNRDKKEDAAFLIKNYGKQRADLQEFTKDFVNISKTFTAGQKAAFK